MLIKARQFLVSNKLKQSMRSSFQIVCALAAFTNGTSLSKRASASQSHDLEGFSKAIGSESYTPWTHTDAANLVRVTHTHATHGHTGHTGYDNCGCCSQSVCDCCEPVSHHCDHHCDCHDSHSDHNCCCSSSTTEEDEPQENCYEETCPRPTYC